MKNLLIPILLLILSGRAGVTEAKVIFPANCTDPSFCNRWVELPAMAGYQANQAYEHGRGLSRMWRQGDSKGRTIIEVLAMTEKEAGYSCSNAFCIMGHQLKSEMDNPTMGRLPMTDSANGQKVPGAVLTPTDDGHGEPFRAVAYILERAPFQGKIVNYFLMFSLTSKDKAGWDKDLEDFCKLLHKYS